MEGWFSFNPQHPQDYKPLEAYGLIGDSRTAALVGADGSIDWACLPDFDSDSVFAALLDPSAGRFAIHPVGRFRSRQYYESNTNVLVTEFHTAHGVVHLHDYMPYVCCRRYPTAEIHRLIEGVEGKVELQVVFEPRFAYGAEQPELISATHGVVAARNHHASLSLSTPIALDIDVSAGLAHGHFRVEVGDELWMVADWGSREVHPIRSYQPQRRLWLTRAYWRNWINRLAYHGTYRAALSRSLLTLKMLTYEPTGAIVAAPTTSLPEWIGGTRNWDYRYTWVRDSAFMLRALFNAGYIDEGTNYFDWLLQQCLESGDLQVLYGIRGERKLPERQLPLRGYRDSAPVRVGNGAAGQFQLDIYGSLLDAAARYDRQGGILTITEWEKLRFLVERVRQRWREPDAGIWESRSGPAHYTYGKVWAWVGLVRAVSLAERLDVDAPVEAWKREAEIIRREVLDRSWNADLGAFTQRYDSTTLDAAVLIMPTVGILPANDPRFVSTLRVIQQQLGAGKPELLYRYHAESSDDGVGGQEGAFLMPSFWRVNALALAGQTKAARAALERLLHYASPLGVFSEEYDPEASAQLGNMPQGFSHLGLVNAIFTIEGARAARGEGPDIMPPRAGPQY